MSEYNETAVAVNAGSGKKAAIVSMVMGIIAICLSTMPVVGLILAIIALSLAKKARLAGYVSGFTKAGRTTGKIALIFSIISTAVMVCYTIYAVCLGVFMQLLN